MTPSAHKRPKHIPIAGKPHRGNGGRCDDVHCASITCLHAEAANWFRKTAGKGVGTATLRLDPMYAKGRGVPRYYAEACVWMPPAAAFEQKSPLTCEATPAPNGQKTTGRSPGPGTRTP